MKAWSKGLPPTDENEVKANRLPGANNAVLAEQARRLHLEYGYELYLQFEIADAIGNGTNVAYASTRKDQGTAPVADEFIAHTKKSIQTAVVVAHQHHFERCRLILEKKGITGLPTCDLYSGYDPFEAQPRVMSPEEFIVNDFASMAGMM